MDDTKIGEKSKEKRLEELAVKILKEFGVPQHLKGYRQLKTTLMLVVQDESLTDHLMTKVMYPLVAEKHGTEWKRVERNIREAIKVSWTKRTPREVKAKYFGEASAANLEERPTNGEYIVTLSNAIREALNE